MAAGKVLAAIDVGSNSIKLLVARRDPDDPGHAFEVLREKEMVRLGQQTLAEGALSEEAMEDGLDCLARYAALARAAGAESIATPHLTEALGYRRVDRGESRDAT